MGIKPRRSSLPFLFSLVVEHVFLMLPLEAVIWRMFFYYPVINVSSLQCMLLLSGAMHNGGSLVADERTEVYLR